MKCPKCGKELENDAKFCRYCGKEIEFRKEKKKRKGLLAGIVLLILFLAGGVYALQSGMMDQLRKESVNIVGNTCGNLSSEGAMAQQGKWLYYSKGKELCKARDVGVEEEVLCTTDPQANINVVGEWIYFSTYGDEKNTIRKIRTDGTEETELLDLGVDSYCGKMVVYDDTILYQIIGEDDFNDWNGMQDKFCPGECFTMKTDGTARTSVLSDNCHLIGIDNGWIYYMDIEDNGTELTIMRQNWENPSKVEMIYDSYISYETEYIKMPVTQIAVKEGWIYCGLVDASVNNNTKKIDYTVSRIQVESGDIQSLYEVETKGWGESLLSLNITDDWVYWIDRQEGDEDYLYTISKVSINGNKRQELDKFERNEEEYVFLHTTDHGGYKEEIIYNEDGTYERSDWTKVE